MSAYELAEKHLGLMDAEGDPHDRLNTFRRTLYELYPEFMPFDISESEKDDWMYRLGQASTYAAALENVFRRHLTCSKSVFKFIMHRDLGSMLLEATQRAAGLYDPPLTNKILATVRAQLLRWRHEGVTSDDNVSNSVVVVRVLQLREHLATMLRHRSFYGSETFPRMYREIFSSLKERTRAFFYDQRLAVAAHGNMIKQSRYNMATFVLMQMSKYDDNTLPLIRSVLEKATFYAYTEKLISLDVLNDAAKNTPYGDIVKEQAEGKPTSSSNEPGEADEAGEAGEGQVTKDDSLVSDVASQDAADPPESDEEPEDVPGPPLRPVNEVIKITTPDHEFLDPTGTYTQPRAFIRPPPKRGHKRSFLSVAKEAAKLECEEDIKIQRQEEERHEEMTMLFQGPPSKRAKE